jgi:phosphate transport system protein
MNLDKNDLRRHLSGQFNTELEGLMARVREMGQLVLDQLSDALDALERGDLALADRVVVQDKEVNRLELGLDEVCRDMLVQRQPAAGDLRLIFAVLKVVMDLERMGDLAKRIAKATKEASGLPRERFGGRIGHLGTRVVALAHKALAAFVEFDGVAAAGIRQEDRIIDDEVRQITGELQGFINDHPDLTSGALQLVWATRSLERFGDHAKSVAEFVFYVVYGKELRHMTDEERRQRLPAG